MVQLRQGVEAQQRNPLHAYHSRVRLTNYDCYFFEPITLQELDKVRCVFGGGGHATSIRVPVVAVLTVVLLLTYAATALSPSHCTSWIRWGFAN
jgi:hypothetical protein